MTICILFEKITEIRVYFEHHNVNCNSGKWLIMNR